METGENSFRLRSIPTLRPNCPLYENQYRSSWRYASKRMQDVPDIHRWMTATKVGTEDKWVRQCDLGFSAHSTAHCSRSLKKVPRKWPIILKLLNQMWNLHRRIGVSKTTFRVNWQAKRHCFGGARVFRHRETEHMYGKYQACIDLADRPSPKGWIRIDLENKRTKHPAKKVISSREVEHEASSWRVDLEKKISEQCQTNERIKIDITLYLHATRTRSFWMSQDSLDNYSSQRVRGTHRFVNHTWSTGLNISPSYMMTSGSIMGEYTLDRKHRQRGALARGTLCMFAH